MYLATLYPLVLVKEKQTNKKLNEKENKTSTLLTFLTTGYSLL